MVAVRLVRGFELSVEQILRWSQLQEAQGEFSSPYFRPEFTQTVATVRDDVEVAVLEKGGEAVGFFPFQRGNWEIGRPVGGRLSDFQGVVADNTIHWDARDLVERCGLSAWQFDHLVASQQPMASFHQLTEASPYIDLSAGFEAYRAERKRAGSSELEQTVRKARKLEREVGPIRFVRHTDDRAVLDTLIDWKAGQYHRSKIANVFAVDWTVALLEALLRRQEPALSGMLSALYAGDRLVAAHFGMRSFDVLHCWFPAYDVEYSKYSPGLILLVKLARAGEEAGIRRIDLGRGSERYKQSFSNGAVTVAEGVVDGYALSGLVRRGWQRTKQWVRSSPLHKPARASSRWMRHFCGLNEFL